MKYNLQWIIKHKGNFTIDEQLIFPDELFGKYSQINGLKDITVKGTGDLDIDSRRLYVNLTIEGIMLLPCALTLEEVEYPFTTTSTEVFAFDKVNSDEDIHEAKKNIVDLTPVVFENIMLEVPMRVVKENAEIKTAGRGWKILDNTDDKGDHYIDPRLAKLKDYFKDK